MTEEWLSLYQNTSVEVLSRASSDHSPLLLKVEQPPPVLSRPFRFQNFWIKRTDFLSVVRQSWEEPVESYGMFMFASKLKRLKGVLRAWNAAKVGNVFDNLKHFEHQLRDLERVYDETGRSADLVALNECQAKYFKAMADEESYWKQRSRVKWLADGDRNTKFFHASTMERRARLRITRIKDQEGAWLQEAGEIGQHAVDFFQNLFSAEPGVLDTGDSFLDNIPQLVTNAQNGDLLRPVSMEEVKRAVFSLDSESAPGPDGYPGSFYQHCWDIIASDLLLAVQDFFAGVPIPRIIASAAIVLLPKKQSPSTMADFRPICLCTFISKIFTRLMVDRLTPLLPSLISENQSAFLKGREITDNILLTQELLQHLHRRSRGHNIIFKLDMMKAFDRVSWPFLKRLLLRFGFHPLFVQLVMQHLSSSWFSILINGVSFGFFQPSRGVKQGDPLSPLLFILITEALSRGLGKLIEDGQFVPYLSRRGAPVISHLSFADDLIVFTRATRSNLRNLFAFFQAYEMCSGQRINKGKSSFYISRRCSVSHKRIISHIAGITGAELPMQYLGCTLFQGRRKNVYFHSMVHKVLHRLDGWKGRLLSSGGRLILIRHILQALPIHVLSAMDPTRQVLSQLEQAFSRFFWGNSDGSPRRTWRAWDRITFPTLENGLGVRGLHEVYMAFSCKLYWKFKVGLGIWSSYVTRVGWRHSYFFRRMRQVEELMEQYIGVRIVDGSSSFWTSNWLGTGKLSAIVSNPSIPNLKVNEAYITSWQVDFFQDDIPAELLPKIMATEFYFTSGEDELIWTPSTSGSFSVASAYDLSRRKNPEQPIMRYIWRKGIPLKISILMWRIWNNLLPFDDVLMSFGFLLASKCVFCPRSDSIAHAFYACPVAADLWSFALQHFHVDVARYQDLRSMVLFCWSTRGLYSPVLSLIPLAVCWILWKARNERLWEGTIPSPLRLRHLVTEQLQIFTHQSPIIVPMHYIARFQQLQFIHIKACRSVSTIQRWDRPAHLKLNVDGSSLSAQAAGGGIIVRNAEGFLLGAESIFFGQINSLQAEMHSMLRGLQFCHARGLLNIEVEIDFALLVQFLRNRSPWPWQYHTILEQIRTLLALLECTLKHIYRESNAVADALAKLASTSRTTTSFSMMTLPPRIKGLILLDRQGCPYVRTRIKVI